MSAAAHIELAAVDIRQLGEGLGAARDGGGGKPSDTLYAGVYADI